MIRDHFTRPVQSDRTAQSYGHTRLTDDAHPWAGQFWPSFWIALLCAGVIVAVGMVAVAGGVM